MCFKSCIIKEVFSKNWPISNGYQKVAIILTSEFSYTGWRLSHMWEMISNCTVKVHRTPTEDFRVTQHISPATPVLRKVKVHTFGPSELLGAPTTYGRNAGRGAKNFNKIMQFWSSFLKKGVWQSKKVNISSAFGRINTRRSPEGDMSYCILNKCEGR